MQIKNLLIFIGLITLPLTLTAKPLWQEARITYLKGSNYLVGDAKRQVITVEHAMSTTWGDSFFFLDHMRTENNNNSNYAEWSPRISLCKVEAVCLNEKGFLSELFFASTIEMSSQSTHLLYGVGANFKVPYFTFFQLNAYKRNNEALENNWQLTASWLLPFSLFGQNFVYDGFIDYYDKTADQSLSRNFTSQLKWRVTELLNLQDPVYLGFEYVRWKNKFGIESSPLFNTNESNINVLFKWHF
ncbi:DUF5020 family protein [Algibacillus agarilyticus]|uniref:DUF5020 family protein n=1 Tax=Algibacillus agarilyticus TaxID=2234133 RepID=UPI000DD07555|nr:DUF5020 family protein [Algibacillus agarilyticus]